MLWVMVKQMPTNKWTHYYVQCFWSLAYTASIACMLYLYIEYVCCGMRWSSGCTIWLVTWTWRVRVLVEAFFQHVISLGCGIQLHCSDQLSLSSLRGSINQVSASAGVKSGECVCFKCHWNFSDSWKSEAEVFVMPHWVTSVVKTCLFNSIDLKFVLH